MRLHLVDGTYELFRAHFSKRPDHASPAGADVKATLGLMSSLFALLADAGEKVTHLAIAFDNPIRSFRNDLFDGYKSDEGVPPELRAQFDLAERATRAMGIVTWSMDRHEADDALATAATRFSKDVAEVRILTPDKDLAQVVRGARVVQVDRVRDKVIDEDAVRAARGVSPRSIPDYLALVGDTADGIPGLPGIGERTAAALLGAYEHLERIPDDPATWSVALRGRDKIASTLTERRDDALLYRTLATLVLDVPLPESLDDLAYRGVRRGDFEALCDELGSASTKKRPTRYAGE